MALSHGRRDVLVELEQIGGVIGVLQRHQPLVLLGAIGGLEPFGTLVGLSAQIAEVIRGQAVRTG